MNLNKLFEMQRELDEKIINYHDIDFDIFEYQIHAFLNEVGECGNEWQGFKHWKVNNAPKDNLLEEYIDGVHFLLSIGLIIGHDAGTMSFYRFPDPVEVSYSLKSINTRFLEVYRLATMMGEDDYYHDLFQRYLDLGHMLGFTWEQIEEAYLAKNAENHKRQESGY